MTTAIKWKAWGIISIGCVCLIVAVVLPATSGRPGSNELKLAATVETLGGRAMIHNGLFRGADLSRTKVCDEDMAVLRREIIKLKEPRALRAIILSDTHISDHGIENLKGLESHQLNLRLDRTKISDIAMTIIAEDFLGLHSLELRGTAVTEAGLARLKKHPTLKIVHVSGPNVNDEVVRRLNCRGEERVTFNLSP